METHHIGRKMIYSEEKIEATFAENLEKAKHGLVAVGNISTFRGLNGWVYEQTIRSCLNEELSSLSSIKFSIEEQFKIKGRASADLLVGKTAIEIKSGGVFGKEPEKYKKYKAILTERGYSYLYITKKETHAPYREAVKEAFGGEFCFFLTDPNSWESFVNAVLSTNKTYINEQ